jgi:hypothetical protein
MSHVNAALTPRHRLTVARLVVDEAWPISEVGIAPSTVHRILRSARLNRLSHIDRATGQPIRRYEHP